MYLVCLNTNVPVTFCIGEESIACALCVSPCIQNNGLSSYPVGCIKDAAARCPERLEKLERKHFRKKGSEKLRYLDVEKLLGIGMKNEAGVLVR